MIDIAKYSTYFSIRCTEEGLIDQGIYITKFINNKLIGYEYDSDQKRFTMAERYVKFDKETKILSIPINLLTSFTQYIVSKEGTYKIHNRDPIEPKKIYINFRHNKFKDKERQIPVIDFLSDTSNPFRALKLQTGVGKTYCIIKAICNIKERAIIRLGNSIASQWCEEFIDKTDVKLNEIMIIKGADSIAAIFKDPSIIDNIKIFIASSKTLLQYINKEFPTHQNLPDYKEFLKLIKPGISVTDECHLFFHMNTMIDLNSNIKQNAYLSATYVRSNQSVNRIFNLIFPEHLKYDDKHYNRYVNVSECIYSVGTMHPLTAKNKRGYNQIKYEKWLIKNPSRQVSLYENVFIPLINLKYLNIRKPEEKLIIFITMKITGYRLCQYLKHKFPNLRIATFYNEDSDSVLKKAEIIITTMGSCGTGKDVKNLKSVFLFVSFVSEALSYQVLGRLRELKNDTPEFVFMQNIHIPSHMHHLQMRRLLYKVLCKKYETIKLNC